MNTYLVRPRSKRSNTPASFLVVAKSMTDLALQIDKCADPHGYEAVQLEEGDLISLEGAAVLSDASERDWKPIQFGAMARRYRPMTAHELTMEGVSYHLARAYEHITLSAQQSSEIEDLDQAARVTIAYAALARMLVGARRAASWRFKDDHMRVQAARVRGMLDKDAPTLTSMQVLAALIANKPGTDQESGSCPEGFVR